MSTVEIRSLSKRFGDVVALDELNLTVAEGEFVTILGPSGSGKTTLLLTIAGFESPTGGAVHLGGLDVTNVPSHQRNIGLVFQSYALFPHMTVRNNVAYPLRVRGGSRKTIDEQVREALELVRLAGYEDRKPHELSGGQQQRVALARAFVFQPDILLLDEPLAALDRQLRQAVQFELRELQRSLGITTLAVTHDQEEALTMSDRIVVLDRGTMQQEGRPEDVYRRPINRFVANFLGTANVFDGTVRYVGANAVLECPSGLKVELARSDVTDGGSACAILRPEQIEMSHTGEGVPARVRTAIYLGPTTRYRVDTQHGDSLEVGESRSEVRFQSGDEVVLTWDPTEVRVLPVGTAGTSVPSRGDAEFVQ